jgi:DNA-binding NarL/FixJ family response regulator
LTAGQVAPSVVNRGEHADRRMLMSSPEADLHRTATVLGIAREFHEEARRARDAAIRSALDRGLSMRDVARAVGISAAAVHKIAQAAASADEMHGTAVRALPPHETVAAMLMASVSEEDFDRVIEAAAAEGDLSQSNIVRKVMAILAPEQPRRRATGSKGAGSRKGGKK